MPCPAATQILAGPVISSLRMRKDAAEVEALLAAGAAIDRVHALVPSLLRAGRTEREVGADISAAILAPATSESTSSSSAAARTGPARTTRCPTG